MSASHWCKTTALDQRLRLWGLWALKLLVATCLVGYLVYTGKISLTLFRAFCSWQGLMLVGGAALLIIMAQTLAAFRLFLLFQGQDLDILWSLCWKSTFIGLFANNYLPTSFGGDAVKGYYLSRWRSGLVSQVIATLVYDRFLGMSALVLLILGFLGILSWTGQLSLGIFHARLPAVSFYPMLAVLVVASACLIPLQRPKLRHVIGQWLNRHPVGQTIHQFFRNLAAFRHLGRVSLACLGISFFTHLFCAIALYLVSRALNLEAGLVLTLILALLIFVTGIIPVSPGNLGWTEYLGSLLWSSQGFSWGGNLWLSYRLVTVLVSLTGLIVFLHLRRERSQTS
ncbi:MAG: lysylphosphatidylglycerol synthase transmembrane domain-containing protein [Desulfobaccales bacterium]